MMFTILSCLIATSQDKVHWIERLSLAEKTVITTCEVYAECQRSFTLRSDNNVCYKWVPGTISRTLHDTSTLKVSQYHRGSKGGMGSCGAWEHVEQRVINFLFPRWPPLSGKLSLHPVLKVMALGRSSSFLPHPAQPNTFPRLLPRRFRTNIPILAHIHSTSSPLFLKYQHLSEEEEEPSPNPAHLLPWCWRGKDMGVLHPQYKAGEGQRRRGLKSHCALQRAGHGAVVTEAVTAPVPNPLVTYGTAYM